LQGRWACLHFSMHSPTPMFSPPSSVKRRKEKVFFRLERFVLKQSQPFHVAPCLLERLLHTQCTKCLCLKVLSLFCFVFVKNCSEHNDKSHPHRICTAAERLLNMQEAITSLTSLLMALRFPHQFVWFHCQHMMQGKLFEVTTQGNPITSIEKDIPPHLSIKPYCMEANATYLHTSRIGGCSLLQNGFWQNVARLRLTVLDDSTTLH